MLQRYYIIKSFIKDININSIEIRIVLIFINLIRLDKK